MHAGRYLMHAINYLLHAEEERSSKEKIEEDMQQSKYKRINE